MTDSQSTGSLGNTVVRGARDLFIGQVGKLGIHFVGLVLLSRLLPPAVFGYMAIATTLVGIGEVFRDLGLSSASIRTVNLTKEQRAVLFWLNVAIGVVMMVVVIFAAGMLASVFKIPELVQVLPAISLVFLFNGIAAQYRADLNRMMRFRAMASVDVIAPALGLTAAIVLAYLGAGYWALVVQTVAIAFLTMIISIFLCGWLPGLPRRKTGVGRIVGLGGHIATSQLFSYAGNNIDTLALGYFSSAFNVGIYSRAFQLVMAPLNQLKSPAISVALPALSRIADERERFSRYLLHGQAVIGYTILPVAAFIAAAAQPLVSVALGDEWSSAASIVTILAFGGALQQLSTVASWIFISKGLGRDLRNYTFVSLVIKCIAVVSLAWAGPVGVAIGYSTAVLLAWPLAIIWAARQGGIDARPLLVQGLRIVIVALGAFGTAYGVCALSLVPLGAVGSILLSGTTLCIVYAATMAVPLVRHDMLAVFDTLKVAMRRRG
ncbi:lipopolysaccharide biosynthesis protein [Cryobacterium sp. SO1]|uniref:lipopolysaccharide biosynthesis protein n=1 Tax=Cryobacterium sp. SO1 TaxID=1897061 RepID=UPI0010E00CEB|nr:lipopolysaccharide biosynthesis protein [Cryobacterium sp. SO1]RZI37399.1 Teichuronic acid biosynthesis protein TuaB [Cryobacterium sp. SO1]